MKKIKIILLFLILIVPCICSAEECRTDSIQIETIELTGITGYAEEINPPSNNNNQINLDAKMNVLGDSLTYKVTIKNTSKGDYVFNQEQIAQDYINYDISYEDDDNIIKAGEEKVIFLKLNYANKPQADSLSNGVLTRNNQVSFNLVGITDLMNPETRNKVLSTLFISILVLTISIVVVRKNKKAMMLIYLLGLLIIPQMVHAVCESTLDVNLNLEIDAKDAIFLNGVEANVKMKNLAGNDTSTVTPNFDLIDINITSIQYSEIEPDSTNKEDKNIISTPESEYPIYMWYENGTIYWWSEDTTPALQEDSSLFFYGMLYLNNIDGVSKWNTSEVNSMSEMFSVTSIEDLHALQNWNTSNVNDISGIFYYDIPLQNLEGLENWDTSNITNMSGAFLLAGITSLLPIKDWNTSNVTNMAALFEHCDGLTSLDGLENWDTSNVTDMSYTFDHAVSLNNIDAIKNWDVSKVVTMRQLFCTNINLEIVDLSNWKTDSIQDISNMFGMWNSDGSPRYDAKMKKITFSENFDTSQVTNMSMTFANLPLLEDIEGLEYWNTSQVTGMYGLFAGCSSLTTLDISSFDTRNVTEFSYMFNEDTNLEVIYVGENWSTESNTEDTTYVFADTMKLANFNVNNEAYRDLRWAHTGEGGYLTLKTS